MPFVVKLKKASTSAELTRTRFARFDTRPSWGDLASKIAEEFSISSNNVGVVLLDEVDGNITLKNEQELQSFYEASDSSSGKIKFVVQDLQTPDSPKTISSTWSASSNLSDLSKADDNLRLFCWVFNISNHPFPVDIGERMTVGHLKEAIKKKKEHTLGAIDPDTLDLWKLSPPITSAEIGMKLRDAPSPKQIQGCVKLDTMDELSKHFSLALHNRLHVIVEAPPTSQNSNLSHGSSDVDNVLASLHALHTHLWGKDRIDHRDELACSILDLAPFAAFNLIIRPNKILLIRNEYVAAYDYILERTLMTPKQLRATLVTGQPGIGKSLFLFYVLARRLHDRGSVAFQIDASKYYLFDQNGVTLHSTIYGGVPEGTWALSDTDAGAQDGPCAVFRGSAFHVIHTSSPSSTHWKRWVKILGASKYIMDVWGPEEFQTLLALKALEIPRGISLFEKYGPSPRVIVDILTSNFGEDDYEKEVNTAAHKLAAEFSAVVLDLSDLNFGDNFSSKVFTIRPKKTRRESYTLEIPTPFLSHTFGLAMSRQAATQQYTFFRMLSSYPSFRSAAGWLFEHYAHNRLSEPKRKKLRGYTLDGTLLHIPVPSRMIAGSTALKRIQPPHNFYWRPVEPNFKGVDAIIRFKDDVWVLQYTISGVHKPATDGLLEIHDGMNDKKDVKWHLVMVGPELRNAKKARDNQTLGEEWEWTTVVYASELPLGQFDEKHAKVLDTILIEARADSDDLMEL